MLVFVSNFLVLFVLLAFVVVMLVRIKDNLWGSTCITNEYAV
jgi:hypothetical protein